MTDEEREYRRTCPQCGVKFLGFPSKMIGMKEEFLDVDGHYYMHHMLGIYSVKTIIDLGGCQNYHHASLLGVKP